MNIVSTIQHFLSDCEVWCYREKLLESNPSVRLVQPKAPENLIPTFTVEHIERMLAACDVQTPR